MEGWSRYLFTVAEENLAGFQSCVKDFSVLLILQTPQCIQTSGVLLRQADLKGQITEGGG